MKDILRHIDTDAGILIESFKLQGNTVKRNKVLAVKNKNNSYVPASLCKLLTVMLVWDKSKHLILDKTLVRVPTSVLPGSAKNFQIAKKGEVVDLNTLIEATLIMSSNEAAYTLADWHSGNQSSFVENMNKKALSLGLINSKFTSSHGLDRKALTNVEDMSTLAKLFIEQCTPLLAYSSLNSFEFNDREWFSSNKLRAKYPEIKGLKTGFLGGIGANLINYWVYNNTHYLCVVLGAETGKLRYEIAEKVLLRSRDYSNKTPRLKIL